jgi:hypothetical protein
MLRMIRRPLMDRGTQTILEHLRDKLPPPDAWGPGPGAGRGAATGGGAGQGSLAAAPPPLPHPWQAGPCLPFMCCLWLNVSICEGGIPHWCQG